jgi:hypothetical protein
MHPARVTFLREAGEGGPVEIIPHARIADPVHEGAWLEPDQPVKVAASYFQRLFRAMIEIGRPHLGSFDVTDKAREARMNVAMDAARGQPTTA